MQIILRNNTSLPKKYMRLIKWKLYRFSRKFKHLLYAEVHLNTEGNSPELYRATVRLGVSGNDIIINHHGVNVRKLIQEMSKDIHRYLAKRKNIR